MPMPFVTSDVIASVRVQGDRLDKNVGNLYCFEVLREMKEENPNLASAIIASVNLICKEHDCNTEDLRDISLKINIVNLAASVYSSIKQQMVCNELENGN